MIVRLTMTKSSKPANAQAAALPRNRTGPSYTVTVIVPAPPAPGDDAHAAQLVRLAPDRSFEFAALFLELRRQRGDVNPSREDIADDEVTVAVGVQRLGD